MLKQMSKLECNIADKKYEMHLDSDSPLQHVKEALFQFLKYVGQIEDNILAQQKAQEESKDESQEQPVKSSVELSTEV